MTEIALRVPISLLNSINYVLGMLQISAQILSNYDVNKEGSKISISPSPGNSEDGIDKYSYFSLNYRYRYQGFIAVTTHTAGH